MKLKLYKLRFESYLHSGTGFQEETIEFPGSDTMFLAVASTISEIDGKDTLEEFLETQPLFSSTFPYYKKSLFLPKPMGLEIYFPLEFRKKLKGVKWVEKEIVEKGKWEKVEQPKGQFISFDTVDSPYTEVEIVRNARDRIRESTTVFTTRAFKFLDVAGLYFLYSGNYDIDDTLQVLGEVGIGGGKSVGMGKFNVESEKFNWEPKGDFGLLLSKCIPDKNEVHKLKNAQYLIGERGGWTENTRKRRLRVLIEGSILPSDIRGRLVEEKVSDERKVYRNYRALVLPLGWWSG